MNMLTGFSGNANEQVFYSNAGILGMEGSLGEKMQATAQIFPGGQSGFNEGEWKMVNRPIDMGFFKVDNFVLEFVPSGTKFVGGLARKSQEGVQGIEGVFMPGSIQAVGTGNVFTNKSCPAGSIDEGLVCKFPERWEECEYGEVDMGFTCQSGDKFRQKKMIPSKIMPKY
jgi:hypothetical protein